MAEVAVMKNERMVPHVVMGTIVFVLTEVMFFCALISAFNVIRSRVFGSWAPPFGITLPVAITALNTLVLLASGVFIHLAVRKAKGTGRISGEAGKLFLVSILLGALFVAIQGYEWVKLIGYGMSMTTGIFSATFFMLIGSHGAHALVAVLLMAIQFLRFKKGQLTVAGLEALRIFWGFIVLIWPILYGLVYFA